MQCEQYIDSNRYFDAVVIGGGVVGVCSAYYLAKRGYHVALIEQGEIGSGCSHGNAGLVTPSHSVPVAKPGILTKALKWSLHEESPFYIKPRFDLSLFSWLVRFAMSCRTGPMRKSIAVLKDLSFASLELHGQLAALEGMDHCYDRDILLSLYSSEKGLREGVEECRLLSQYGIASNVLTNAEVRELEPRARPSIVGGICHRDEAHLDPAKFVRGLACVTENLRVSTITGVAVTGFSISGGKISSVRTSRGDILTKSVVLAAGVWSPGVAKSLSLKVPVQAAKGYSVTVKSSSFSTSHALVLGEAKVIVTPMGPVLRFAGTLELAGLDFSINQRRVQAILRAVREYLFTAGDFEVVETWCGLRPLTPDTLPIIGRSRLLSNLIIATGHGMLGLSLGPITGELVSQLLSDEMPSIDLTLLSPDRFQ